MLPIEEEERNFDSSKLLPEERRRGKREAEALT